MVQGYTSVNKFLERKYKTIVDHYIKLNSVEICISTEYISNTNIMIKMNGENDNKKEQTLLNEH